jgi:hypothetical protein
MKPGRYGAFPYSSIIRRPPLKSPNGAHVALRVILNISSSRLTKKCRPGGTGISVPDVPTCSATGSEIASHYRAQQGRH